MRMQIFIREDLAEVLTELAWREHRWPKQQAEWLLQQALEHAAKELDMGEPEEKPDHPHGGPPGQTGDHPDHPHGGPPGQDKPDDEEEPTPEHPIVVPDEDEPHPEPHGA